MHAKILRAALTALVVWLAAYDGAQAADGEGPDFITFKGEVTLEQRPYVENTVKFFLKTLCRPLALAWGKGYSLEASVDVASPSQVRDWGWAGTIEFSVHRPTGGAVNYMFGAGKAPGIDIWQHSSAAACGWRVWDSTRAPLMRFDGLAFLDDLPVDAEKLAEARASAALPRPVYAYIPVGEATLKVEMADAPPIRAAVDQFFKVCHRLLPAEVYTISASYVNGTPYYKPRPTWDRYVDLIIQPRDSPFPIYGYLVGAAEDGSDAGVIPNGESEQERCGWDTSAPKDDRGHYFTPTGTFILPEAQKTPAPTTPGDAR